MISEEAGNEAKDAKIYPQTLGFLSKCPQVRWYCAYCYHLDTTDLLTILSLALRKTMKTESGNGTLHSTNSTADSSTHPAFSVISSVELSDVSLSSVNQDDCNVQAATAIREEDTHGLMDIRTSTSSNW